MGEQQKIPKTVFISGGTALHKVSSFLGYLKVFSLFNRDEIEGWEPTPIKLGEVVQHSSHIITCFDSGGSSAILREVLPSYPAVGDLRNRLCSIAQGMVDASEFLHQQNQQHQDQLLSHLQQLQSQPISFVQLCKFRLPNEKESSLLMIPSSSELLTVLTTFAKYLGDSNLELALENLSRPLSIFFSSQLLPLVENLPQDLCALCGQFLESFLSTVISPVTVFNCYNASLGNLILTGAYLQNDRNLVTALDTLSACLGISTDSPFIRIIPASTAPLTLGARLQSGDLILGQHAITRDKGATSGFNSPIRSLFLIDYRPDSFTCTSHSLPLSSSPHTLTFTPSLPQPSLLSMERSALVTPEAVSALLDADLICYSIGSFFTSLVASILPTGLSTAIRMNQKAVKVYIPNMILDTEMIGLSLYEATDLLLKTMHRHEEREEEGNRSVSFIPSNYLSIVLLDRLSLSLAASSSQSDCGAVGYPHFGSSEQILESVKKLRGQGGMGVEVLEEDICSFYDERKNKIEVDPLKLLRVLRQLQDR
jgi:2-phospho-L-lactate transferase/gluconeogenesis factor (CofD/UPF0052 family)